MTLNGGMVDLPPDVGRMLDAFVGAARDSFGDELVSVVLFGSAAEGRMRRTSDVNLIVVLRAFDPERAARLAGAYQTASAAIHLDAMFLLEAEVPAAVEAFAVKFADVLRRRRVLHGPDPFTDVRPSRQAEILRLRQVLLNLTLRLRRRYLQDATREEQLALAIADAAGPLRAAAAALLELEGRPVDAPKAALAAIVAELPSGAWGDLLAVVSAVRETSSLPSGVAGPALLQLLELARLLGQRAAALSP
jgi:predicted nucleotidyltransferase